MKSPFSYYGGKQRMASKIVPLLPKHTVYVEPFAGSAAIMFAKPWPDVSNRDDYREVLNDHDGDLVNFFRVLRDYPDDLVRVCCLTPYSREEHALSKKRETGIDDIERARRFFVSVAQSFSGNTGDTWSYAMYRTNKPRIWQNQCASLYQIADRLQSVYIECDDVLKVIRRWDSPQTCFYCDPPYPGANQGHYAGYSSGDFLELVELLDVCEGSFLLSCYDQPNMPPAWERFEFKANCTASKQGVLGRKMDRTRAATQVELGDRKRTEIVWRVIRGQNVRPEIKRLYEQGKFDCFKGESGK